MNSWWLYERNFQRAQPINPFNRASRGYDARPPIRLTLNVILSRTKPFRRQILLTEYLLCLEITCQVLLSDFRRLLWDGKTQQLPEANSLIVSVCQVSFGPFFFASSNYHPSLKLQSENISNPQVESGLTLPGLNACSYPTRQEKKTRAHTMDWYENSAVMADR